MSDIATISIERFVAEVTKALGASGASPIALAMEMTKLAMVLEKREAAVVAAARSAALEEAAQLVENECECSHGSSLLDAAARIRALKGKP